MKRHAQRGAALLIAMLTVALVATFAAASLWQQWRSVEVETAERARVQSTWILTGALDWARLLLREDKMGSGATAADHLGEPWAIPLQEAKLSSFLAADANNTSTDLTPDVMDAFLSGQIVDMQSKMNINNMMKGDGGGLDEAQVEAFGRLFEILGLPGSELAKLAENLRFAATSAVTQSAQAPLMPQRLSDLVWLGISPQTIAVLEPYVTVLRGQSPKLNVNTAAPEAIAAATGISISEAQRMVQVRTAAYFTSVPDFQAHLAGGASEVPESQRYPIDIASHFFEVRARLRLDKIVVEEHSLVEVNGTSVTVLRRERGSGGPDVASAGPPPQR